jgi:hypothetical protein
MRALTRRGQFLADFLQVARPLAAARRGSTSTPMSKLSDHVTRTGLGIHGGRRSDSMLDLQRGQSARHVVHEFEDVIQSGDQEHAPDARVYAAQLELALVRHRYQLAQL